MCGVNTPIRSCYPDCDMDLIPRVGRRKEQFDEIDRSHDPIEDYEGQCVQAQRLECDVTLELAHVFQLCSAVFDNNLAGRSVDKDQLLPYFFDAIIDALVYALSLSPQDQPVKPMDGCYFRKTDPHDTATAADDGRVRLQIRLPDFREQTLLQLVLKASHLYVSKTLYSPNR